MPMKLRMWILWTVYSLTVSVGAVPGDTLQLVHACRQVAFPHQVPAGNYSGICHWRGNDYFVVSDKSETDGFFVFSIEIDSLSGEILSVENRGFRSAGRPNRDGEGIAWVLAWETVLMSGEADGRICEYGVDGQPTMREVSVPEVFGRSHANLGLEALTYSPVTRLLWTCNEATLPTDGEQATATNGIRNRVRLQSFGEDLLPCRQYAYEMDAPISSRPASVYAMGVPGMVALDNGSLLVLEREFHVPSTKLGAFVNCKLYQVWPGDETANPNEALSEETVFLPKHLVCEWKTSLTLFRRQLANYEGACLGPRLADGSQVLVLVADSQDQYGGVLKDWFKTIVVH